MKISTRLKFNALLFAVVVFVIALLFAMVFKMQKETFETSIVADNLVKASYELNTLSSRYLRYPAEGPKEQWLLVYRELEKNLKSSVHERHGRSEIINRMRQNLSNMKELFGRLVEANEKRRPSAQAPSATEGRPGQIADLIIRRSRNLTADADRLASLMNDQVLDINRRITIFAPFIGVVLAVITVWLSFRIGRSISSGIGELRAGAEAIGSGDLDYRIGLKTHDELGLLSQTFDHMTESLKAITVSRDKLEKEVTERTRAEEALRKSESTLKQAGQMARLGAWEIEFSRSKDPDANPLHWSDEVYRIFGYEPGTIAVSNKLFFERVHPEDRHVIMNAVSHAIATKSPYSAEHRIVRPDGSERFVFEHAEIVFANGDQPVRIIGAIQDVTERKRAELALEQSKRELERSLAQLETIFDSLTDGLVVADLDANLFHWNPAAIAMHGFSSLEECQRRLPEFADIFELSTAEEGILPVEQWPLARILRGENLHGWEVRVRRHGTDWHRVFSYGGTLARDRDGEPLLAVVIVSDITERKRRDEEFKKVSRQNELILEYAGEGIFGLDMQGNVTFVNAVAAHMLGYGRKELLGSHSHRTWHYKKADGSPYPSDECPIYAAYNEGSIHSGEETFWRKDGTGFPVDFTSRPLYEGGNIAGAVVMYRDVTGRKRAEEELREREERFRALYEQAAVGIELMDFTGTYIRGNGMLSQMLGYSEVELQGLTFAQLTHPDDLSREMTALDQLLAGRIPSYSLEKRYLHKNGRDIWVRVTSSIARTSRPYRISIIEDITDRKRAEDELQKLLADLERSNKDLEQFAYVASHDLQEPLRMVASYVQLFERKYKGHLDEKADKYIHFAVDGVKRMQRLIDGLLAYSRVARGVKFARVDANRALAEAVLNLSASIRESGAVITKDALPGVYGDETQLTQLFQNLVGNAIKFRKPDVAPVVHVSAARQGKEWVFSVRDNGIGLDPQYTQRIFLIFQRLHARDEYPGTGIGLALCKRIVERHHGRIWVESEPGQGSAFFFSLPVN